MGPPRAKRSRSEWVREGLVTTVLLALAVSMSGCSTPRVGPGHATTSSTRSAPVTTGSTSGPVASPPLEVAQVTIVLSGSMVQLKFARGVVTGRLHVVGLVSDSGGMGFSFTVTGVHYTAGGASTKGSPYDPVTGVTVSASGSGALVDIGIRPAGSSPRFTVTGDEVVVVIS